MFSIFSNSGKDLPIKIFQQDYLNEILLRDSINKVKLSGKEALKCFSPSGMSQKLSVSSEIDFYLCVEK